MHHPHGVKSSAAPADSHVGGGTLRPSELWLKSSPQLDALDPSDQYDWYVVPPANPAKSLFIELSIAKVNY